MEIALLADSFSPFGHKQFILSQALPGVGRPGRLAPQVCITDAPRAPGCWVQLGVGGWLPGLHKWPAPGTQALQSSVTSSEVPVHAAVLCATPLPTPVPQETMVMGAGRQIPRGRTPRPQHCRCQRSAGLDSKNSLKRVKLHQHVRKMQKKKKKNHPRTRPPLCLVWGLGKGQRPCQPCSDVSPNPGRKASLERSGFQMSRSHEGHRASLHPAQAWGRPRLGGVCEGIYRTAIEKGNLMCKYKGHTGWGGGVGPRKRSWF